MGFGTEIGLTWQYQKLVGGRVQAVEVRRGTTSLMTDAVSLGEFQGNFMVDDNNRVKFAALTTRYYQVRAIGRAGETIYFSDWTTAVSGVTLAAGSTNATLQERMDTFAAAVQGRAITPGAVAASVDLSALSQAVSVLSQQVSSLSQRLSGLSIVDHLNVLSGLSVIGNVNINGDLSVPGAAYIQDLLVSASGVFLGTLSAQGGIALSGALSGATTLAFQTSGVTRLTIDGAGHVSVNAATGQYSLVVGNGGDGAIQAIGAMAIKAATLNSSVNFYFTNSDDTVYLQLRAEPSDITWFGAGTRQRIVFNQNAVENPITFYDGLSSVPAIIIKLEGSAGIPPLSTSKALLQLGSVGLSAANAAGTYLGANPPGTVSADFVHFQVSAATRFRVDISGNISSPTVDVLSQAISVLSQQVSVLSAAKIRTYDPSGSQIVSVHAVLGTVTLDALGSALVTLAGAAAYTSAGSYECVAQDDTGAFAVAVSQTLSTLSFNGTALDVIRFICLGN